MCYLPHGIAGMSEDMTLEVLGFCISTGEQCRGLLEDIRRRGIQRRACHRKAVFGRMLQWYKIKLTQNT